MSLRRQLTAAILLTLAAAAAPAHDLPVAYVGLDAQADGGVTVTLKEAQRNGMLPRPVGLAFDPACRRAGRQTVDTTDEAVIRQWPLACDHGLEGATLRLSGLDAVRPHAIVHLRLADGTETYLHAGRHDPQVRLSTGDSGGIGAPLGHYFGLGVEHILAGPDHLLFVLGLVLVIWRGRAGAGRLLATVTAFTAAHSITLALATLGGVTLPSTAVEATIALSILLLAVELATHDRRRASGLPPTLTFRKPWLVAFAFGLLHGFGFAGALAEIGLPEGARAWALLLFNLGVEAGQLLFVCGLVAAWWAARGIIDTKRAAAWATTLIGAVASFWLIERAGALIGA